MGGHVPHLVRLGGPSPHAPPLLHAWQERRPFVEERFRNRKYFIVETFCARSHFEEETFSEETFTGETLSVKTRCVRKYKFDLSVFAQIFCDN